MAQSPRKTDRPTSGAPDFEGNPLDMTDEEFDAKAREGLRHYRETGLHLTHEEVKEWMRQRASGNRVPMPKLHT